MTTLTTYEIGIDYTPAYEQGGGIGRYVREMVSALLNQDDLFHYRLLVAGKNRDKPLPFPENTQFQWRANAIPPIWWARLWHRAQLPIPVEWLIGKVKVFHATDFVLPPVRAHSILTVHDLSYVRVPSAASPSLKAFLDAVVPRSVARADRVLADSQSTKDDLIALYNTPSDKITVLYSGVDARFVRVADPALLEQIRRKYHLPSAPFILSVGTVQPRKNYERLIRALWLLRQGGIDVDLVIVGGKGWLQDGIYRAVQELKLSEHVHFAGFVDDQDLPGVYTSALLTAFPSLYEGFGLPILESMACGTPVLTSNISSLPEVVGDAGIQVTPTDVDEIAAEMKRLIDDSDLRSLLVQKGYAQAARFSWLEAAEQLRGIYRSFF